MTDRPCRLAVLASHPIQYFTPIYQRLARRAGVEVDVMFYRDFGVRDRFDKQFGRTVRWDTDQLSGYRYRFLTNISPISDTFTPLHAVNPGAFFRVLRGFDAIWVNGYTYPSNWLAAFAARARRIPILFRSELRLEPNRKGGIASAARDAVIRRWIRWSDALLYIGEANRRAYLAYGAREGQLHFSPYSADVERIGTVRAAHASPEAHASLRRKWGVPVDVPVVLFVGKLIGRKHPEVMLRLAASLLADAHIVVAGSGPMEPELREQSGRNQTGNIAFLGFVNQKLLPEVYALADVFVLPSEDEPWGIVLNEAMAAGLVPIVSDQVGAAPDLIREGETGYVVAAGDTAAIMGHVRALLADPPRCRRMADAAREQSRVYDYDATAEGVVDALRSVGALDAPRTPRRDW